MICQYTSRCQFHKHLLFNVASIAVTVKANLWCEAIQTVVGKKFRKTSGISNPDFTFGLSTAPHIINNVLAVKNRKHYRWAPVTIFVIYFVVIALIKISGYAVRAMVQTGILPPLDTPDSAFIAGIKYVLPEYAWAFIGTVVLAAVMSTTDRLLLTIGNCFGCSGKPSLWLSIR